MELEFGGRRYPVPPDELILGADPAAGLVLPGAEPRHAVVRRLGDRMATVRVAAEGARILVNGVAVGAEPTPLLHGDVLEIGAHRITVLNPGHPAGGPDSIPEGARERLHDTLFGVPRPAGLNRPVAGPGPVAPGAPATRRVPAWVIVAGIAGIVLLAWLLLS
ncbi:MAG TPA: FHA domain-containing protein [Gemmatimonadales bacterium]